MHKERCKIVGVAQRAREEMKRGESQCATPLTLAFMKIAHMGKAEDICIGKRKISEKSVVIRGWGNMKGWIYLRECARIRLPLAGVNSAYEYLSFPPGAWFCRLPDEKKWWGVFLSFFE
jgi:hypothetical protein